MFDVVHDIDVIESVLVSLQENKDADRHDDAILKLRELLQSKKYTLSVFEDIREVVDYEYICTE